MFIYLDTETTGTGADDRLCQIAFKIGQGTIVNELFKPGKPIAIEAMAVHHITNEMVKDKPAFRGSAAYQKLNELVPDQNNDIVAHTPHRNQILLTVFGAEAILNALKYHGASNAEKSTAQGSDAGIQSDAGDASAHCRLRAARDD